MYTLGSRGEQKIKLETASEIAGEDIFVVLSKAILAEDLEIFLQTTEDKVDKKNKVYTLLANLITAWDIVLADGSAAPINAENIAKLPAVDIQSLQGHVNFSSKLDEVKKNNSSLPSPETTT